MSVAVSLKKIHRLKMDYVSIHGGKQACFLFTEKLSDTETLEFLRDNLNLDYMKPGSQRWDAVAVYVKQS